MADLNRGQTPKQKHQDNAAQFVELNKAIAKHSKELEKAAEEGKAQEEQTAEEAVQEELGDDSGFASYGTPEYYEREYIRNLPPPLRALVSLDVRDKLSETLPELDIGDILMASAVQTVPVVPNKFHVTFRTLATSEEIAVENLIVQADPTTQKQAVSLINLYRLALSVRMYGNDRFADHRKADGTIDLQIVKDNFNKLKQLGHHINTLSVTHLSWFDRRVYATLAGDQLKNG